MLSPHHHRSLRLLLHSSRSPAITATLLATAPPQPTSYRPHGPSVFAPRISSLLGPSVNNHRSLTGIWQLKGSLWVMQMQNGRLPGHKTLHTAHHQGVASCTMKAASTAHHEASYFSAPSSRFLHRTLMPLSTADHQAASYSAHTHAASYSAPSSRFL
jgi:hypothetical protein